MWYASPVQPMTSIISVLCHTLQGLQQIIDRDSTKIIWLNLKKIASGDKLAEKSHLTCHNPSLLHRFWLPFSLHVHTPARQHNTGPERVASLHNTGFQ